MNPGKEIFNLHLSKVENLLNEAKNQQNPALWLFENGLRTPMFMLEATARVYEKVYDNKDLEKRKEQIKLVEDAIGAVDYYNAYAIELATNLKIKPKIIDYLHKQKELKLAELNKILEDENWLDGKRIEKIKSTLNDIKWLSEKDEFAKIKKFFAKAVEKINEFMTETTFDFDHVEDDIHELRRRLRWLSIYTQALNSVFKYAESNEKVTDYLKKYSTQETINSKFNILPTALKFEKPIDINKNYFFALSWIIAELGKIKDEGLRVLVLKEAIENTDNSSEEISESEVYKILNEEQKSLEQLLSESEKIVKTFFEEKNIDLILV